MRREQPGPSTNMVRFWSWSPVAPTRHIGLSPIRRPTATDFGSIPSRRRAEASSFRQLMTAPEPVQSGRLDSATGSARPSSAQSLTLRGSGHRLMPRASRVCDPVRPSRVPRRRRRARSDRAPDLLLPPFGVGGEGGIRTHAPLAGRRALQARTFGHSVTSPRRTAAGLCCRTRASMTARYVMLTVGGEGGIRTHERGSPVTRFRVVRIHPLCHLSTASQSGAPGLIRTGGLQLRRLLLYPTELRGRNCVHSCRGRVPQTAQAGHSARLVVTFQSPASGGRGNCHSGPPALSRLQTATERSRSAASLARN